MFRVNTKLLDPILKAMLIVGKHLEKDNNDHTDELGKDLTYVLLSIMAKA